MTLRFRMRTRMFGPLGPGRLGVEMIMTMMAVMTSLETGRKKHASWHEVRSNSSGGSLKQAWTCKYILPNPMALLTIPTERF